jgi:hypothetical protein
MIGFYKMLGIYREAAQFVVSREVLSSTELIYLEYGRQIVCGCLSNRLLSGCAMRSLLCRSGYVEESTVLEQ